MEVNLKRPFVDNYGEAVCELRKGVPELTEIGRQISKLLFNLSTLGGVRSMQTRSMKHIGSASASLPRLRK